MAEGLKVRVRIRVSPALVYAGLVAFCLLAVPARIVSESVSLQTFYPAPSAVYQDTLTSQQTWLARDNGAVGIGTAQPPASSKIRLAVMGRAGIGTLTPQDQLEIDAPGAGGLLVSAATPGIGLGNLGAAGLALSGGAFVLTSPTDVSGNPPHRVFIQQGLGTPAVTADGGNLGLLNPSPAAALDVGGDIVARGCAGGFTVAYGTTTVPYGGCPSGPPCTGVNFTGTVSCPRNHYATWIAGVMSNKQQQNILFPVADVQVDNGLSNTQSLEGSGSMLCCPCPGGTCQNLP